jgi:hypothetical protein
MAVMRDLEKHYIMKVVKQKIVCDNIIVSLV